jgi:DNA primase
LADKEEIRSRNDIVEVINTFVPLKKKGKTYSGLCPFHQEKTPSFNVDSTYQSFKCFGCGASGDVFTFVERYENMNFVEAAEFLARRVGLSFDRGGAPGDHVKASERDLLYEINETALAWFRKMLGNVPVAKDYAYGRGLVHETIQKFKLGYAPEGWSGLADYLSGQRKDLRVAETAGLVRKGPSGDYYDVFRHRFLFPIQDEQERVVGFGGRAFGDDQPKYLNTGETPIFVKSKLLYGLPFARRTISSTGKTLLMEGYMDVIAAHQAGFTNAVATLGTSLTDEHAKKLARLVPENPVVVLVYDADAAGIKATLRASEILEKESVEVRVVRLPDGDDPDTVLKRGEIAKFQQAIDKAAGRIEYLIGYAKSRRNVADEEGRLSFLSDVYRILAEVESIAVCDKYLLNLAELHPMAKFGVPSAITEMRKELAARRAKIRGRRIVSRDTNGAAAKEGAQGGNYKKQYTSAPSSGFRRDWQPESTSDKLKRTGDNIPANSSPGALLTAEERAEAELMRALAEPEWRKTVLKNVEVEDFVTPLGRRFLEFVIEYREQLGLDEAELIRQLNLLTDPVFSSAIGSTLQEIHIHLAKVPITLSAINQCIHCLRKNRIRNLQAELTRFIQEKQMLTNEDQDRVQEMHRILEQLVGSIPPS